MYIGAYLIMSKITKIYLNHYVAKYTGVYGLSINALNNFFYLAQSVGPPVLFLRPRHNK